MLKNRFFKCEFCFLFIFSSFCFCFFLIFFVVFMFFSLFLYEKITFLNIFLFFVLFFQSQLLILEGRYEEAESLLRKITRLPLSPPKSSSSSSDWASLPIISYASTSSPQPDSGSSPAQSNQADLANNNDKEDVASLAAIHADVDHQLAALYALTNRTDEVSISSFLFPFPVPLFFLFEILSFMFFYAPLFHPEQNTNLLFCIFVLLQCLINIWLPIPKIHSCVFSFSVSVSPYRH